MTDIANTEENSVPKGVNGAIFEKVHQAKLVILNHPISDAVDVMEPLGINEGGSRTPFNKADFKKAIEGKPYKCGGSMWMQNLFWVPGHRTPTRPSSIEHLQSYFFPPGKPPAVFPFEQIIFCDGESDKVWGQWGAMQRVSPQEPFYAALLSCRTAIETKCSDEILRKWRVLFLNVRTTIEKIHSGDDRFWRFSELA